MVSLVKESDFCVDNPLDSACIDIQGEKTCVFDGKTYSPGDQVTAYLRSSVPTGQVCVSEKRRCASGAWTGSYAFSKCNVNAPASCLFDGRTISHNASVTAYLSSMPSGGAACVFETRKCTDGVLSGSYPFAACETSGHSSCLFDGRTIAHGQAVTAYKKSTEPFGASCLPATRRCLDGVLSGEGEFSSCAVNGPASCLFNTATIAHNQSVTAYTKSSVPFGQSCQPVQRTCVNGALSGTGAFASCSVAGAASCILGTTTIPHNGSVVRYTSNLATLTLACTRETRVCSNGALSGSATHPTCSTPCPVMVRALPGLKAPAANDIVKFGNQSITYGNAPSWMLSGKPFSDYANSVRTVAFHMVSRDCGATWKREQNLNPMKLDGRPEHIGNGPSTTVYNMEGNALNRGFFSHINWQFWWRSRIYPYFDFGNGLEYQALAATSVAPNPIIGSPDLNANDHFYSPSPVANANGSVQLYFGGWRNIAYTRTQLPVCSVNYQNMTTSLAHTQKDCWCPEAEGHGVSTDMCSGDKIFVATNNPQVTGDSNALNYKVYSKNGAFSTSGWGSSANFEAIVWPALINTTCPTGRCPYKVSHANDPSVIKTKSGKYIMYFTAGIGPIDSRGKMINYTYLGSSDDGINFSNFAILSKASTGTGYFPFGLPYNQANGTAKAYYDAYRDRIYIAFLATPDSPIVNNVDAHPDAWKMFVHEVAASDPDKVLRTVVVGQKDALFALPQGTVVPGQ